MTELSSTRTQAAEGVSTHLAPAAIVLVVGGGLAILPDHGTAALLAGVAVTQAVLVVSWVFGTAMPGRLGGIVLGGLTAAGADVAVSRFPGGQLGTLLAVAGLALPAMFVHQLTRGVVRTRVFESLSDIALMLVCVLALSAFIQLRHETGGVAMSSAVLAAITVALVVGHLVDLGWSMPRFDPAVPRGLVAVLVATAAAGAVGYLRLQGTVEFTSSRGALVGTAVGAAASLFAVGAAFIDQATAESPGRVAALRPVFGAVIPLALSAPVAYLLCLAIRG
ncbi:MAG: hypothetical protein ABJB98_04325 [Actinomycetota bacterium]